MTIEELERRLLEAERRLEIIRSGPISAYMRTREDVAQAQRELAAAKGEEYATPCPIGVVPDPAVSGAVVLQTEHGAVLTFNGMKERSDGYYESCGTAIVRFKLCCIVKFGYPNDEARAGHPLKAKGLTGYGVFEVMNSTWIRRLTEFNRITFPAYGDVGDRHYMFNFHDSTFECVANSMQVTIRNEPYDKIFSDISHSLIFDDKHEAYGESGL